MVMSLGACGKAKEDEFTVTQQESESVDSEINNDENTESEDSQINNDCEFPYKSRVIPT